MEDSTQILKKFNLKFSEDVNELLKCSICKNVLVDACVSPCMCKFCWNCIERHLKHGGKPCPGAKDDCKKTFLNSVNELEKDAITNRQISILLVKCPNENCDHCCQLKGLPDHMRTCPKSAVECVFSYVGCADKLAEYNKMKEHLDEQLVSHGKSLVAHIRNMENEMKDRMVRYEMILETLKTENTVLRQIGEGNALDIERMKAKIGLLSSKEETLIQENSTLKGELHAIRENTALHRTITDGNVEEMVKMKDELCTISCRLENIKSTAKVDVRRTKETLGQKNATLKVELDVTKEDMAMLRRIVDENSKEIEKMNNELLLIKSKLVDVKTTEAVRRAQETMAAENTALKGNLQAKSEDVAALRQRLDECERRQVETEKNVRQISDANAAEMSKLKKEIEALSSKTENDKSRWQIAEGDLRQCLEKRKEATDALRRIQEDTVGKLDKLSATLARHDGFVWRIEKINLKLNKSITEYSCPFFSDGTSGYKLCLCYCNYKIVGISSGLNLTFCLMRGDDDDRLQWPMCRTVLIEIIDEQCAVPLVSRLVSCTTVAGRMSPEDRKKAYDRPTGDRNGNGDGFVCCVKSEQIKSTAGVIRNDSMTVRCRVLPQ